MPNGIYPFRFHRLDANKVVAISPSGDYSFLDQTELEALINEPQSLPINQLAELKSKYFIGDGTSKGSLRLLASRLATKKEMVLSGPSLHIIIPTLQCAHTCRYCQVSRSLDAVGYSMPPSVLDAASDTIFESPSKTLTVEFQGGDPLFRYDLIVRAIERIEKKNFTEKRDIRFVVASSLHQLNEEMCCFFKEHKVFLSTSIDGPAFIHNRNRPLPTRDAYERTIVGIEMARDHIGRDAVSALMTTTRDSLSHPEEIVDEYVRQGFSEIFLRPISPYGFAKRNQHLLGYKLEEFENFYERAFERILYWNNKNVPIREVSAAISLNKMLSPFDYGYVDLQSPTGAGLSVLAYNYDGYVYPSDEARMLAESGDVSLRLGAIGEPMHTLLTNPVIRELIRTSISSRIPGCSDCAFNSYCGPDPIGMYGQFRTMDAPVYWTDHCKRNTWLFDFLFRKLQCAGKQFEEIAYQWATPTAPGDAA